jgi:hypothetical protein
MKNNKLIAEFMGYEVKHGKCYSPKYKDGTIAPMQFDKSWDWLMPVIAKIVKDYGEGWSFEEGYDLSVRYQSVVEFIKTYNDEKN